VLIALAALLSGHLNRRGQLRRVIAAFLCVAALEALSLALQDVATRSLQTVPAMYAAAILPSLGAMVVLLRAPRRARGRLPLAQAAAP
jgi:lipopolysaccharide export system permease protein